MNRLSACSRLVPALFLLLGDQGNAKNRVPAAFSHFVFVLLGGGPEQQIGACRPENPLQYLADFILSKNVANNASASTPAADK